MQELSDIEKHLIENPHEYRWVERGNRGATINYNLSDSISSTLNKIKGRIDEELGETGDLEIEEYIEFKNNYRQGFIKDMNIFNETFENHGLDIVLMVDCSGSMGSLSQRTADIVATIMHAIEKTPFINLRVFGFSAESDNYQGCIEEIKNYKQAGRIHADSNNIHDVQHLAIDYTVELLENSENKKMMIMITDGYPIAYFKGRSISHSILKSMMDRSITNAWNKGIECFCLFYNSYYDEEEDYESDTLKHLRDMFHNHLYSSGDFSDIEFKLIEKLKLSVESLNTGMVQ